MERATVSDPFTSKDLRDDVLAVLDAAKDLFSPSEFFLLGMNQADSEDWEDYSELIGAIEHKAPDGYRSPRIPALEEALQRYHRNQREALEDAAAEVF